MALVSTPRCRCWRWPFHNHSPESALKGTAVCEVGFEQSCSGSDSPCFPHLYPCPVPFTLGFILTSQTRGGPCSGQKEPVPLHGLGTGHSVL